jgi:cephalosporin-C deacetylase-like acetyl esterase
MLRHMVKTLLIVVVLASIISLSSASFGQTFVRMELRPIESTTLTGEQFLTGDKNGKLAMLAGELRIPKPGTDRLPAVVLVHGSGGLGASSDRWAQELNSIGVASFILDSFSGRGIVNTQNDQSQLNSLAMMVDAYRALTSLAGHSRIDPNRIAVMGFSKGAVAAVYSSSERFRKLHGPPMSSSQLTLASTPLATCAIPRTTRRPASRSACSTGSQTITCRSNPVGHTPSD